MAAWATTLAVTGFRYSGQTGELTFRQVTKPARWFWSTGHSWGRADLTPTAAGTRVRIEVLSGALSLRQVTLEGQGSAPVPEGSLTSGRVADVVVPGA
jgi:hypothetical protein